MCVCGVCVCVVCAHVWYACVHSYTVNIFLHAVNSMPSMCGGCMQCETNVSSCTDVVMTSFGRSIMYEGTSFPVRNWAAMLEKLLQLFSNKSYLSGLQCKKRNALCLMMQMEAENV